MSAIVHFGSGGDDPYASMLTTTGSSRLVLRRDDSTLCAELNVADWRGPADEVDLTALAGIDGPLLDVGCGPGRMVRAAAERGIPVLGIDVSASAVSVATSDHSKVLRRSVFERLPLEGGWRGVLLIDGNIGIGGDISALLRRCRELLALDGSLVVEVDSDPELHESGLFTTVGENGHESALFPWARIGSAALCRLAAAAGFVLRDAWSSEGRHFVVLAAQA